MQMQVKFLTKQDLEQNDDIPKRTLVTTGVFFHGQELFLGSCGKNARDMTILQAFLRATKALGSTPHL